MRIELDIPDNTIAMVMTLMLDEHNGSVTLSTSSRTPKDGDRIEIVELAPCKYGAPEGGTDDS